MSKEAGTTGTIEAILKTGIPELTILLSPSGNICVQAKQIIATGGQGNLSNVVHQVEATSLVLCLEDLKKRLNTCESMRSMVIQPTRRN